MLLGESKVRALSSSTNVAEVWKGFDKQFEKHIVTRVLPLLDNRGGFKGGQPSPILHYRLEGSLFSSTTADDVVQRFNLILDKYPGLKDAGFVFDSGHVTIVDELLHPIVN